MSDPARTYQQIALDLTLAEASSQECLSLHVSGHSMAPLLRPGDVVMAQPVSPESLCRGDLVVVHRPAELITHRLVAVDEQGWHTKGDNCHQTDAPVRAPAILGRVVAVERGCARLDLTSPRWARVNRWLGRLGGWEARLARQIAARKAARPADRLVAVFFRVLTRLVLFVPLRG